MTGALIQHHDAGDIQPGSLPTGTVPPVLGRRTANSVMAALRAVDALRELFNAGLDRSGSRCAGCGSSGLSHEADCLWEAAHDALATCDTAQRVARAAEGGAA